MNNFKETQIVEVLVNNPAWLSDAIFFAANSALHMDDEIIECTLHVAKEVPRESLGLELDQKPGDVDLLIIPERKGLLHFDRSIAIEVKVVRPTFAKPEKNAGKMGSTQVKGLARDGFPFVGLLHLEVPEETPEESRVEMPNGYLMDMFPFEASLRQEGRLKKLDLPEFVGFSSTGLLSGNNDFIGSSFGLDQKCSKNPESCYILVNSIRDFYKANTGKFTSVQAYG